MKTYNKLVRDKIPEIIIKNGGKPKTKILSNEEYLIELNKKLQEEVNEYFESESVEEIADIAEVLESIISTKTTTEEFKKIKEEKANKRGSFKNKIFLEEVDE